MTDDTTSAVREALKDIAGILVVAADRCSPMSDARESIRQAEVRARQALAAFATPAPTVDAGTARRTWNEKIDCIVDMLHSSDEPGCEDDKHPRATHTGVSIFEAVRMLRTLTAPPEAEAGAEELTPTDALYGFVAWLTCREEAVTLGAAHDAAMAARLAEAFADSQGLPGVSGAYPGNLKIYPASDSAPGALRDQQSRVDHLFSENDRLRTQVRALQSKHDSLLSRVRNAINAGETTLNADEIVGEIRRREDRAAKLSMESQMFRNRLSALWERVERVHFASGLERLRLPVDWRAEYINLRTALRAALDAGEEEQ